MAAGAVLTGWSLSSVRESLGVRSGPGVQGAHGVSHATRQLPEGQRFRPRESAMRRNSVRA